MSVKLSNDTKVKEVIRKKEYGYHSAGRGLFLRISKEGTGFWVVRYMINAKRREVRIGRYPDDMALADATI